MRKPRRYLWAARENYGIFRVLTARSVILGKESKFVLYNGFDKVNKEQQKCFGQKKAQFSHLIKPKIILSQSESQRWMQQQ